MLADIKKLGSESVIYGISTVLTRLINFFLVPLYTHYLSPDDYGRIAAVFSLIAFLNVFYILGLNQGYMRFKNAENLSRIISFLLFWGFGLSIVVMSMSSLFSIISGIEKHYHRVIYYAAFIVYLDSISSVPLADLRMEHKAYFFVGVRSFSIVLNVVLNFLFLKYTNYGIDGVFYAAILSSLSQVVLLKDYFKFFTFNFSFSSMKEIFSYSFPYVPASLSSVAIQLVDRPIMMHFLSPYSVGLYQANFRLGVFMSLIVSMFDFAWRPFVIERIGKPNAEAVFRKVFEYFSFFMIYVFLIISLFIKDIITMPVGKDSYLINPNYWSGWDIVPIVMVGYVFFGFYVCFMASTIITKKTIYSMKANIISSFVSVILNFMLVPVYNIYGAAYSFVLSNLVLAAYMYFKGEKIMKVGYPVFKVMFLFVSTILLYMILNRLSSDCIDIQIKIFAILVYPFVVGALGYFDKNDIEYLKDWLKRKLNHL